MQEKFICPICDKESKNLNFHNIHLNTHKRKQQYPNGIDCCFCQKHFSTVRGFKRHITEEHNTYENRVKVYQYLTNDLSEHLCENCGKLSILSEKYEYKSYCEDCKDIVYKKHHSEAMRNLDKSKIDYNARNQKSKKTLLEETGYDSPCKNPKTKEKMVNSKIKKYGENYGKTITDKSRKTYKEKTGYDNPRKNPECIKVIIDTKKSNLKDGETLFSKCFDTLEKNTGYRYPSQNPKSREKTRKTWIKNYNVDHPQKFKPIKNQTIKTFFENREKGLHKNPWLDENFKNTSLQKQYETKRINNTFNKSNKEDELFEVLKSSLNVLIERQKRDLTRFPFNCDFYFPNYDLFVDFHGTWLHGEEKFDENNVDHILKLNKWKNEAEKKDGKSLWSNAIYTWTDLDVRKYKIAENNNLNYLVFYTYDFEKIVEVIFEKLKTLQYIPVCSYNDEQIISELKLIENKNGDYNSTPSFNKAVLHFQPHFYEKEKQLFKNENIRNKLIQNREKYLSKNYEDMSDLELLRGFKISGIYQGFSHFSPLWIKAFIEEFNIKSIYDPCGGWGHRFLGSTNIKYIYNDVDRRTIFGVKLIKNRFEKIFKVKTKTVFYNEDASNFTPKEKYDAVFTCPPYFNKEKYNNEKSSSNFNYDDWLKWLEKTIETSSINCKKYIAIVLSPDFEKDFKTIMTKYKFIKQINLGLQYKNFKNVGEKKFKDVLYIFEK